MALLQSEGVKLTSTFALADRRQLVGADALQTSVDDAAAAPLLASGAEVRRLCRMATLCRPTAGLAPGYAQANLVVIPSRFAADFRAYCKRNPAPCPLLVSVCVSVCV